MDFAGRTILVMGPLILLNVALWGTFIYVIVLLIKALRKYLRGGDNRPETVAVRKSLGEAIKAHRSRCSMTQELVAERLGVSRQAVSKWESDAAYPETDKIVELCKLFALSADDLLLGAESAPRKDPATEERH